MLSLHEAADGWLARIRLPGGIIRSTGLEAIAQAAALGSGVIELTARASVQIRGLGSGDGRRCAALLAAAGLLPSLAHDRARNILASPFGGRHPASLTRTDELVGALDELLCGEPELAALPGRFLFAIDDGTGMLGGHRADVALVARADDEFELTLRGRPTGQRAAGRRAAALAIGAARRLLGQPAAQPSAVGGGRRDLSLGELRQNDGRVALTAMPRLARLDAGVASGLAALLEAHGTDARISPQRTITIVDLPAAQLADVRARVTALGLIDDARSPWSGLSACAGLGCCKRALLDVRALAQRRAGERAAAAPPEHWAACERRCGRPAGSHLAHTATPSGIRSEWVGWR